MAVTLYGIAASRTARPLWVLEELGIPYQRVKTDYRGGGSRTAEMLKLNPNGHLPVLDDHGVVVWESMACTLYLARHYGTQDKQGLGAQTAHEEAELLRWSFWTVTEVEKDALIVLEHRLVMPEHRRDPSYADKAEKRLMVPLRVLEAHLQDRQYLAGERFTVADINVASVVTWIRPAAQLLASFPRVSAWLKRCLDRPAQMRVREMARIDPRHQEGLVGPRPALTKRGP
jgi:glutathione S-transferase